MPRAAPDAFVPASVFAREDLLDHAKHPRNRGELPDADAVRNEVNPLCGDDVTVYVKYEGQGTRDKGRGTIVERMTFTGHGCIISQAAASKVSEDVAGKTVEGIRHLDRAGVEELLGGTLSPSRVKCALLPLVALQRALGVLSDLYERG